MSSKNVEMTGAGYALSPNLGGKGGGNGFTMCDLKAGQPIKVFYRMDKQPPNYRYIATRSRAEGIFRPRHGITDGWLAARVAKDFDCNKYRDNDRTTWIEICYHWTIFFNRRGIQVDEDEDMKDVYHPKFVQVLPEMPPLQPSINTDRPDLGFIVFRWGASNSVQSCDQWGETGSSASDAYIRSFFDRAVVPTLGTNYEVWTVYVEGDSDFNKIADSAQLIFNGSHPINRCKHVAAMYFLYPTYFHEDCVPFVETGSDGGAAHVYVDGMFRCMRAMEKIGIPTRFPHPANLYQILTSKNWTYYLGCSEGWYVPATVAPSRAMIESDWNGCAKKIITSLEKVKLSAQGSGHKPITKGVAKLGYSWEGLDVKFWKDESGLREALKDLLHAVYINGEPTGQVHDCDTVIIQEYIPYDIEMRMYVINNKVEQTIYTKFCSINDQNDFKDFRQGERHEALNWWFANDDAALTMAEQNAQKAIAKYMPWLQAQTCEEIPAIRFDFFVVRDRNNPGKSSLFIAEICEVGFSMLACRTLPDKVFAALLKSCFQTQHCSIESACDKRFKVKTLQ